MKSSKEKQINSALSSHGILWRNEPEQKCFQSQRSLKITSNQIYYALFRYAFVDMRAKQNVAHTHFPDKRMVAPPLPCASFSNVYLVNVAWQINDCIDHIEIDAHQQGYAY